MRKTVEAEMEKSGNVVKSEEEWRKALTPEEYRVTRQHGTERAFSHPYYQEKSEGMYRCVCCGQHLFRSERKYDSGTGWPSFDAPIDEEHIEEKDDRSLFRKRTEVVCSRCDAHLGHVFPDGPPETTGMRYCINSAALDFEGTGDTGQGE